MDNHIGIKVSMEDYLRANQKRWDHLTLEHKDSAFYDIEGFKTGKDRLCSIELSELGDVTGKSLLHLLRHFGMDRHAWARRGAEVSGIDFSDEAIRLANSLLVFTPGTQAGLIICQKG